MKIWLFRPPKMKGFGVIRYQKAVAALALLPLIVYGVSLVALELNRLPPLEEVRQGLAKTVNAQSYRYSSEAKRIIDREESVISEISGEKSLNSVHIKGNLPLVKSMIEVYRIDNIIYRRDSLTADWLVVPLSLHAGIEQLIAEVNPLAILDFSAEIDVKSAGTEKVQGRGCRVYEVIKRGESKYLELYWTDYTFRLWIDKRDRVIRKAEVRAEHRDNSRYMLEMTVLFWDYNEPINIEKPILGESPSPFIDSASPR